MKTGRLTMVSFLPLFAVVSFGLAQASSDVLSASLAENPVYRKNCAKCHGKTGAGRHFGGPSLVSGTAAQASADDLHRIVTNGKGRMPKFSGKLAAGEIQVLVEQIKAAAVK